MLYATAACSMAARAEKRKKAYKQATGSGCVFSVPGNRVPWYQVL